MEGLITSESVAEGHPDKFADQIADAILDSAIEQDPDCRIACDVLVKNNTVMIAGEFTTTAHLDFKETVSQVVRSIGYADNFRIITEISQQSADISRGVNRGLVQEQGAGDQGIVIGYACTETEAFMPAPIFYSHRLMCTQAFLRKNGEIPWLGCDAKCQLTFRYERNQPVEIMAAVLSTQHRPEIDLPEVIETVIERIIKPTLPAKWLTKNTQYFVNPTGRFVIGGPMSDCGLTGRKIVIDSYGTSSHVGGGCFSGKDPSKVDRSGAYAARYIAKNIVAAGLATHCEIQVSYIIGIATPIAMHVETFGTGKVEDAKILQIIRENFDLRPHSIIQTLNLLRPIYFATAKTAHFGYPEYSWEQTNLVNKLKNSIYT